ncbi:K(+) efflux antiporter 4-like isoform X3 [Camellia sinensis]|uniref:K(+) efflux antiporter 4-like isoform X3 n=1 Tax=Camellia sinensis TaxID=4442 RepID=UPI001035807D|nr:K(+) efflux antiporter 4-like isoform X3 [Camellia sinensis]
MRTTLLSLLLLLLCFLYLPSCHTLSLLATTDSNNHPLVVEDANATAAESNSSRSRSEDDSFADIIDRALQKEFTENDDDHSQEEKKVSITLSLAATDPGSFNNSVSEQQAVMETVARVRSKKNDTKEEKSFQLHDVFNLDNENRGDDMPTLIDRKDNVFIISNPKSKFPVLQLDLRLISDLVVLIVSATCGGIAFACAGQPVITGYLLAGSVIGPGGFSFVSELVQVETVAQFGVVFLLFALGLEFSATKLRVVRAVAVLGGLLQIFLFMCLCGVTASVCLISPKFSCLCGGEVSEGVFIGAFLSMSSTAVVLKFLMEKSSMNALHGQITIGTLISQDCAVGLLFALLPVLGGTAGALQGVVSMTKSLVVLITFLAILSILSRTCVPWFLKLMISLSSQTNELYQLAAVAFCLLVAWCSDKLGLSLELGSFAAGVMISTTELAQHTLEQDRISKQQSGTGRRVGDLYVAKSLHLPMATSLTAFSSFQLNFLSSPFCLRHSRLGHLSVDRLRSLAQSGILGKVSSSELTECRGCKFAKMTALPFHKSASISDTSFSLVFTDVWGPSLVFTKEGSAYYVSFVNNCTRYTWVYLMTHKSDIY